MALASLEGVIWPFLAEYWLLEFGSSQSDEAEVEECHEA